VDGGDPRKVKFTMRPVKSNKLPLLYGASFLLDVFGSGLATHCRSSNINSDYGSTIRDGFEALGRDFEKTMSEDLPMMMTSEIDTPPPDNRPPDSR